MQFMAEDHSDHFVALYLLPSPVSGVLPLEWASCLLQQPQCSDAVTLRGTGHVDDLDLVDICHACRTTPAEDLRMGKKPKVLWHSHGTSLPAGYCTTINMHTLNSARTASRLSQPAAVTLPVPQQVHTGSDRSSEKASHLAAQ